jgi:serine/threonine protein kinase/tetratricopeptide (TPR) repeat protein
MDHPNIAKVLDAGTTEAGRPYFVMEYVRGVGILEYCDTEKLDTEARLNLFVKVCHAIQHAHQKGIIHRDIKPSNVMVTLHDGIPVPKVIDFGVAKATNTELTRKTLFTEHRQMIGTPAYMSPEQAEMSGLDIDTRSDIYSLGVLLYELLTGTTPFDSRELMSKGFAEMMRIIREQEPHKPSTRLSTLGDTATRTAAQRGADPRKLGVLLRGDLDWIVMQCLEKDRTRRYETANGIAADIERHQRDEPIVAGRPSTVYRIRKFVRRNRSSVAAASMVLLALVAGVTVATVGLIQANHERDRLQASEEKSRLLRHLFGGGQVSLAVLPLENRSSDPEHGYLADGLTTSLISDLSRISALRVTSDQSVRSALQYSGSGLSLREMAANLKVDGVVTGWVDMTDDRVHLTVQLIHALTNQELSERVYREELGNMQTLERAVSRDIVATLQLDLTPQEQEHLASAREIDPEAQIAVLKGLHLLRKRARKALLRAIEFFDQAIAIDPEYAGAHAARAAAYTELENQFAAPLETMPYAKASALRAIELDPSLAAAHTAIGRVYANFDWDWDAAEAAYRRAIELDPDYADAFIAYALFHAAMDQPDTAMEYIETAIELDPFIILRGQDGPLIVAYLAGRYDKVSEYANAALELDAELWYPYTWLGLALAELGEFDEAIVAAESAKQIAEEKHSRDPDDTPAHLIYAALGGICARAALVEEDEARAKELVARARATLDRVERLRETQFICPYETATVHIALGDMDTAFEKLYEAIEVRSACIPILGVDPRMEPARNDERFAALIRSDPRVYELIRRVRRLPSLSE